MWLGWEWNLWLLRLSLREKVFLRFGLKCFYTLYLHLTSQLKKKSILTLARKCFIKPVILVHFVKKIANISDPSFQGVSLWSAKNNKIGSENSFKLLYIGSCGQKRQNTKALAECRVLNWYVKWGEMCLYLPPFWGWNPQISCGHYVDHNGSDDT